jgi:single-stranded-DNA-specific exonuclease
VAFGLGPRLNAAGRLGTALDALRLLLTDDEAEARSLASSLNHQNTERRALEERVHLEAEAQLATWFDPSQHAAIVLGSPAWHPGVIGIVASRIQRRHHRPTIVIGFDETGLGKGSGRSIAGLSLVDALTECAPHLARFGGHALAAGLSIAQERFDGFRDAFLAVARASLSDDQLVPSLILDQELGFAGIDVTLLEFLQRFEPFGIGHRAPVFYLRGVQPSGEPRVLKEKHLNLQLRHSGRNIRAMWFGAASQPLPRPPWDIAFEVHRNEYQGTVTAQVHLVTVRSSDAA